MKEAKQNVNCVTNETIGLIRSLNIKNKKIEKLLNCTHILDLYWFLDANLQLLVSMN